MPRPSLAELAQRCQKPDHRRIGNWMARRVARPVALRITWLVADWGVSANMATLSAWVFGLAAAAALAYGSIASWLVGAALLQVWYVLDHVDGQLARLRGTSSLDGVQLDYLMHHTLNVLLPLGIGWGIFFTSGQPVWMLLGVVWGSALLLVTLQHDARYKAFIQRLKRVRGTLRVVGGAGYRPTAQPPIPRHPLRRAAWAARKACEAHVLMNLVTLVAVAQWALDDHMLTWARSYAVLATLLGLGVAVWTIAGAQREHDCEQEFARWFQVEPGSELVYEDGQWMVQSAQDGEAG
jgi:phosphatidylglycerophosphate synthase